MKKVLSLFLVLAFCLSAIADQNIIKRRWSAVPPTVSQDVDGHIESVCFYGVLQVFADGSRHGVIQGQTWDDRFGFAVDSGGGPQTLLTADGYDISHYSTGQGVYAFVLCQQFFEWVFHTELNGWYFEAGELGPEIDLISYPSLGVQLAEAGFYLLQHSDKVPGNWVDREVVFGPGIKEVFIDPRVPCRVFRAVPLNELF